MSYYDDRMIEIQQDRNPSRAERELDALQVGTEAINRGLANPFLWLLVVGGFVLMSFTGGASLLVSIGAGIAMNGGPKNMVKGVIPMSVDIAAPRAGCIRIVASLVTIILVIVLCAFVAALVAFEGGLIG